jgi:DNA-binding XRE family transcriptional regulator
MDQRRRRALESRGWTVGTAEEFLGLTQEESTLVEMRLSLARGLRTLRTEQALTQQDVARRVGSSQSRIAKMEAADPSVSFDLLIRTLLGLGAGREAVAEMIKRLEGHPALPPRSVAPGREKGPPP